MMRGTSQLKVVKDHFLVLKFLWSTQQASKWKIHAKKKKKKIIRRWIDLFFIHILFMQTHSRQKAVILGLIRRLVRFTSELDRYMNIFLCGSSTLLQDLISDILFRRKWAWINLLQWIYVGGMSCVMSESTFFTRLDQKSDWLVWVRIVLLWFQVRRSYRVTVSRESIFWFWPSRKRRI